MMAGPCLCGDPECRHCFPGGSERTDETCPACDGSGQGPCVNCGDGPEECACDDSDIPDCDQCDGTGVIEPSKSRPRTQAERHALAADHGVDTWEDYRGGEVMRAMSESEFVAMVMRVLPQLTSARDSAIIQEQLAIQYRDGWAMADSVAFMRCTEEVNPGLSEDVALARMKQISDKYCNVGFVTVKLTDKAKVFADFTDKLTNGEVNALISGAKVVKDGVETNEMKYDIELIADQQPRIDPLASLSTVSPKGNAL